jgi:4-methyl-5(b-hydroxyethyl)-thiazole monophosphate biosynthesis
MDQKQALVPIADGSEEIEAVTIIDVLRRAETNVTVASVGGLQVTASRGVRITADCLIADCAGRAYDVIALPGGMPGAEHLRQNTVLKDLLVEQAGALRLYAAICAAPAVVLHAHGLLTGRRATCHPSFMDRMPEAVTAADPVVVDGHCITSQGPGTAAAFALKLVELLFGAEKRSSVATAMVCPDLPDSNGRS